ncbi:translation elongation factor 2, partial [Burkholderia pseudomallei]
MSRAICPDYSGEPHVGQAGEDRRIPRIGLMRAG